jgi:hypothetical protein
VPPPVGPAGRTILGLALVQTVLFIASLWLPGLGVPGWHHLASLLAAILLVLPWRKSLQASRAFLGIGVLATTFLAVASGFFILYWKVWLKAHVLVDWIKFWHVFWSWLGLVFFAYHTWINRIALLHWWRRIHSNVPASLLLYGGLLVVVLASAYTWTPWGKDAVGDPNYILLTWYGWLVLVVPLYLAWWGSILGRTREAFRRWNTNLPRIRVRGFVDVALVPVTVLANLSGFPITFWKDEVHGAGFKFAGKATHTAPSIVMAVLIFMHVVHLWGPTMSHWRRLDGRLPNRGQATPTSDA